jgi:hypothetical protein
MSFSPSLLFPPSPYRPPLLLQLDTTLEIFKLREKHFENSLAYQASIALRSDVLTQMAPGFLPVQRKLNILIASRSRLTAPCFARADPLSYTFYSQAAYTHGPYVAKYRLQPILDSQTSLSSTKPKDADEYPTMIASYFTSHPAKYSFDMQMCEDLSKQSVEDTQKEWEQKKFPWVNVGVVDFPVGQDTASDARRVFWEGHLGSGPFEGLSAHRPLGSVNR